MVEQLKASRTLTPTAAAAVEQQQQQGEATTNNNKKNSMSSMQWRQTFQLPTPPVPRRVDATSTTTSGNDDDDEEANDTFPSFGFNVSVNLSQAIHSRARQDSGAASASSWSKASFYDGSTITSVKTKHGTGASLGAWTRSVYDGSTITSGVNTFFSATTNDIRTLRSGDQLPSFGTAQQSPPTSHHLNGDTSKHDKTSTRKSRSSSSASNHEKQPLWFVCSVSVLLILILFAIVGATACGLGYCKAQQQPAVVEPSSSSSLSSTTALTNQDSTVPPTLFRGGSSTNAETPPSPP